MASQMSHLPHLMNMHSGFEKWDPVHSSIFEVQLKIPTALKSTFKAEEELLIEQVTTVNGLEALQKTTAAGEQKFHGVTVSYLNPTLDTTSADIVVEFNLNLRKKNDNFVLRLFKEWLKLSYDLRSGTRGLKRHYCGESMLIAEANRDGTIWRAYAFKDVMVTQISGLGTLDYSNNEAAKIQVTFRTDCWEEVMATGATDSDDAEYTPQDSFNYLTPNNVGTPVGTADHA